MIELPLREGPLQAVEVQPGAPALWIKRDDLMHPFISGNKGRKLRGHLATLQQQGLRHLVTCGGPYSNHVLATAAACHLLNIDCTILIRGYQQPENPYRQLSEQFGAQLHWLRAEEFAMRREIAAAKVDAPFLFVDTGGEGSDGESGCEGLWDELPFEPDVLVLATATGTTMRGILRGRDAKGLRTTVYGIPVLFNTGEQRETLENAGFSNWELVSGFEGGGYARASDALLQFCVHQSARLNAVLDPVYTGKAWFGLMELLEKKHWPEAENIVFLHTGGTYGLFTPPFASRLARLGI